MLLNWIVIPEKAGTHENQAVMDFCVRRNDGTLDLAVVYSTENS